MDLKPFQISCADNVFALVAFGGSRPPFARLMFSAFEDGTVVWSHDRTFGGAPYFTADIGSARLRQVLDRLEADGLFSGMKIIEGGVLSSECSCFVVRRNGVAFDFESSHEQFEEPGECVAEHDEIRGLEGRRRFDVLCQQPQDYIFSRMIWLELRRILESMIPSAGKQCDGQLEMLHAEFRWLPGVS